MVQELLEQAMGQPIKDVYTDGGEFVSLKMDLNEEDSTGIG